MRHNRIHLLSLVVLALGMLGAQFGMSAPATLTPVPTQRPVALSPQIPVGKPNQAIIAAASPTAAAQERIVLKATVRDYTLAIDSPWRTAISEMKKRHPNVDIQIEGRAYDDQRQKTLIAVGAGQGPDIVQVDCIWLGEFANGKILIDLSPYYATWKDAQDVPEAFLKSAQFNGKYYGVWLNSDVRFLVWEKAAVKAAGLDPSVGPKTWDELGAAAQKAQQPPRLWGYGFPAASTDHTADRFYPLLWQGGGEILSPDYNKAAFNSAAGVAALQFMTDLMNKYKVSPPDLMSTSEGDVTRAVDNGQYAYGIRVGPGAGADRFKTDVSKFTELRGVAQLPVAPGGKPATGSGGWLLGISRDSKHPDLAWEFITIVTDPANATPFWKINGMVPVRKSALGNIKEFETTFPYFGLVGQAVTITHFRPPVPAYNQLSPFIVTAIQKALSRQATPKQALDEAAAAVDALLSQR